MTDKVKYDELRKKTPLDQTVLVKCARWTCDWKIVWHQFGLWVEKDKLACEKCGAKAEFTGVSRNDVTRLGRDYVRLQSKSAHYDRAKVDRKISMV